MAYYAALVSLMGLLEDIIHGDQYSTLHLGRETVVKSLYEKSSSLEESLKDYASKGDEDGDRVEDLIKDAVERAEDIILSVISMKMKSSISPCSMSNSGSELKEMEQEIDSIVLNEVEQEIDSIVQELTTIKERQRREKLQLEFDSSHTGSFEQGAPSGGYSMVGFDKYQNTIKEQLCGQSSKLQVIPIVGTGGIGKTTLARNTFDDSLVTYYFDHRGWTAVSQDYRVKDVLNSLLKSLGKADESNEKDDESVLKERLYKLLKGRRFLIIIDDIWSTKVWDDLKHVFPDDRNGSRIMLTTRLLEIAQHAAASGFIHEIQLLSEEDSWDLLQNKVFGQDCCPLELEDVGRSIASKCYGLPLAIVVIAGILSKTRIKVEWEEIARNVREIFSKSDEKLSSILSLSYDHLPHQLKACFLHMGSFPEDYVISVSSLICLWVAEGLLRPPDKSKRIEMFGEECLEDLVKRNLVLITKKTACGKFKLCVLHDLLRDFCKQKASSKHFFCSDRDGHGKNFEETDGMLNLEKTRHLNFYGDKWFLEAAPSDRGKRLRSLLWLQKPCETEFDEINWDGFEHLKILSADDNIQANSIPEAILRMFHLKYLRLSIFLKHVMPLGLPPSISALQNLQTLVIRHRSPECTVLPPEIWKLTKLRHIIIDDMILPPPAPLDGEISDKKLACLQTLTKVSNFTYTDEVINMIPNLRKLKTHCRDYACKWDTFNLNNLIQLLQLEELKISFNCWYTAVNVGSFPNGIAFPVNLKKLSLYGCRLPWECMKVVNSLPNLQVLRLRYKSFMGDEWESIDGEFCRLKFLLLDGLDLRCWQAESSHFPGLEHLKIRRCHLLEEIPQEIGDITTLKYIDIYETPHVEDSAIQIQLEQECQGNEMLQVRIGRM